MFVSINRQLTIKNWHTNLTEQYYMNLTYLFLVYFYTVKIICFVGDKYHIYGM